MSIKYIDKLKRFFENANIGKLTIYTPCAQQLDFLGLNPGPNCDFKIHNWSILDMITKRGDIGLGEAYHLGLWDSSNLSEFLTYCSINLSKINNGGNSSFFNTVLFYFYNNFIRLNTKYGSKKNILEHYDIGNDFYSLWLDETMTYSSAVRKNQEDSLQTSQINKYKRIVNHLDLDNKKILEIGCGWGGFAEQAVKAGADITAITISNKQYEFAKNRLAGNANILMKDYRELSEKYERIVSIEMFEAVGEKYWSTYFNQIKKLLIKGGKAMIQTITINDEAFPQYRKNSDYIRHHVFPGGMLPSKKIFLDKVQEAKLKVGDIFEFGEDYAWTLSQWQQKFNKHREQMLEMGYSSAFLRAWNFYFSLSIAGFKSGRTNVMQVELES